ncbi:MAG: stage III sporulation protein AF [Lachnospiraceae bacterium]|nr:stage III sporulation protein AF [Lachnospiraceae bacterium]
MISVIKGICIFMIIAQAVLLLVPGNSYMKYVKVLVGILMILMILKPFLSWILGEEAVEVSQMLSEWEAGIPDGQTWQEDGENHMGIYSSIEEELKNRLNQTVGEEKYTVKSVELKTKENASGERQEASIEYVLITVTEQAKRENGEIYIEPVVLGEEAALQKEEAEQLRKKYGDCMGIDPERIEIRVGYG